MALLLERRGEEIRITRDVVEAAAVGIPWRRRFLEFPSRREMTAILTILAKKRGVEVTGIIEEIVAGPSSLRETISFRGLSEVISKVIRMIRMSRIIRHAVWDHDTIPLPVSAVVVFRYLVLSHFYRGVLALWRFEVGPFLFSLVPFLYLFLCWAVMIASSLLSPSFYELQHRLRELGTTDETRIVLATINREKRKVEDAAGEATLS
jgi:hypothetical protein